MRQREKKKTRKQLICDSGQASSKAGTAFWDGFL